MTVEEPIWTSVEIEASCGAVTARPWYGDGLRVDSQDVLPGDLFIALEGEAAGGHEFVADAFERGAVAAVVSGKTEGVDKSDDRLVHVIDTVQTLELMAEHARNRAPAKRIAVAGSTGKTSVVQALRQALERSANTHACDKNGHGFQSILLSLARMPRETRYGVFEIGASKRGETERAAAVVRPDIALVTTVGSARSANFEDEAQIAEEKTSLISALPKSGIAIIGLDHAHAPHLTEHAKTVGVKAITVSVLEHADVRPLRMTEHHNCTCLTADIYGTPVTYKINQPGREWVLNSLLVLAAVKAVGGDLGQAALALASLEAEPGHGRRHQLDLSYGSATLLDDSYTANPLSLKAALRRLSMVPVGACGRRIAVLADMVGLGDKSEEIHMSLARDLRRFNIDHIIAFGDEMAALGCAAGIDTVQWQDPLNSAKPLMALLKTEDVIMVKGANSAALGALVQEMLLISKREREHPSVDVRRVAY